MQPPVGSPPAGQLKMLELKTAAFFRCIKADYRRRRVLPIVLGHRHPFSTP